MARLHTCGPDDWEQLCDLICIIGLGLPVVVASTWRIAGGQPSNLRAHASGITSHAPASQIKPRTFSFGRQLEKDHPDLHFAIFHCTQLPKSKWKLKEDSDQPLAADGVRTLRGWPLPSLS